MNALILFFLLQPGTQEQPKDSFGDPLPAGAIARLGRHQLQHGADVRGLVFAADGKSVFSFSNDRTIRRWDAANGRELGRIGTHALYVAAMDISPGGRLVAYHTGGDPVVRLFDLEARKEIRVLSGHKPHTQTTIEDIAFAPDGRTIATGGNDRSVRIWSVESGEELFRLEGHDSYLRDLCYSHDGKTLASLAARGGVQIWNPATGARTAELSTGFSTAIRIALSPDGKRIAVGGGESDRNAVLGDEKAGREICAVRVLNTSTGDKVFSLEGHEQMVVRVLWSADGSVIASSSMDQTIRIWDAATGRERHCLKGHGVRVGALALSPDGTLLASGDANGSIRLWSAATGREIVERSAPRGAVSCLSWSPDGGLLAAGALDASIRIWDPATSTVRHVLRKHEKALSSLAFSPDGRLLASAGKDAYVRVWNPASGQEIRAIEGSGAGNGRLQFSADGSVLAVAGDDKSIRLWKTATWECFSTERGWPMLTALSRSGAEILVFSTDPEGKPIVFEAATGTVLLRPAIGWEGYSCASRDGSMVAIAYDGVRIHETEQWTLRASFKGNPGRPGYPPYVRAPAFSPDSQWIAVCAGAGGYFEQSILVAETTTGTVIMDLPAHSNGMTAIEWSPDGTQFASAAWNDPSVILWNFLPDDDPKAPGLDKAWTDLAGDGQDVRRAMSALIRGGPAAGGFLKSRLELTPVALDRAKSCLGRMDDEDLETREVATREMRELGFEALPYIKEILAKRPTDELKKRLERLVREFEAPVVSNPTAVRRARAISILARVGGPDAVESLERVVKESPSERERRQAAAALHRLKR